MTVEELQQQWMALRYAVDSLDIAWSYNAEEYGMNTPRYEQERAEMTRHRNVLLQMQEEVLQKKYELERNK